MWSSRIMEEVRVVLPTIWHSAGGGVNILAVWHHIQSFQAGRVKTKHTEWNGKEVHCLRIGEFIRWPREIRPKVSFVFFLARKSVLLQTGMGTS